MNPEAVTVTVADWSQDAEALLQLRTRVFVDEQRVPAELETDGKDPHCLHVKAIYEGKLVGTARLLPEGSIGRMCVAESFRGRRIGSRLIQNLVMQAKAAGHTRVYLNSQAYVIPFYQKSGFVLDSEEFMEAGIAHRRMVLNI